MKKQLLIYVGAFLLVFMSCEKDALEPEIQEAQFQTELNAEKQAQQGLTFRAHLSGDEEVPAVETNATGQTIFRLSKDGSELYYKLIVANIEDVTMAHIHNAPPGENGGAIVWLYPSSPPPVQIDGVTNGILAEGTITEANLDGMSMDELIDLMVSGDTYVNVHTAAHGGGEIRGQITANNKK